MPAVRRRIAGAARRLDGALGRLYYRTFGVVVGLSAVGTGRAAVSAVTVEAWGAALVLGLVAAGLGALTVYCFSRGRRLSELEP